VCLSLRECPSEFMQVVTQELCTPDNYISGYGRMYYSNLYITNSLTTVPNELAPYVLCVKSHVHFPLLRSNYLHFF
jgi:signal transduction histidine kinase